MWLGTKEDAKEYLLDKVGLRVGATILVTWRAPSGYGRARRAHISLLIAKPGDFMPLVEISRPVAVLMGWASDNENGELLFFNSPPEMGAYLRMRGLIADLSQTLFGQPDALSFQWL